MVDDLTKRTANESGMMSGGSNDPGKDKKMVRLKLQKLIQYLESNKMRKKIKELSKTNPNLKREKMESNLEHVIKTLKNRVTTQNYVDYEIDSIIETFFPNAFALKIGMEANPKTVEVKDNYETYMYSNPISNEELNPKKDSKIRPKKQEDEEFGMDYTVLRKDPTSSLSDIAMSQMMGVENMLYILNQTGANTRYLKDYYHGKDEKGNANPKPRPMHVNKHSVHRKYTNKLLKPPTDNPLKKVEQKEEATEDP